MGFTEKNWIDGTTHEIQGASTTPISAVALEDLETRVTDYTDSKTALSVKEYGAVGDGVTNDTDEIQSALTAAVAVGADLYFPEGDFLTTASLASLHDVRKFGPGQITRGTDTFFVDPDDVDSNILYVSTTGLAANDGLSASEPLTLDAALGFLPAYGPVLEGTWTVKLAAGTYAGAFEVAAGLRSRNRLEIVGPDVGGHPNVPTAIINGAGEAYGLQINSFCFAKVKDVKVTGVDKSVSTTAASFHAQRANVWFQNCHYDGDGAYVGISFSPDCNGYLDGGIASGTQDYAVHAYNCPALTLGYNATQTSEAPSIPSGTATIAGIYLIRSYADLFYLTVDAVPVGIRLDVAARARLDTCSVTDCTDVACEARQGSHFNIMGGGNTLTGNTENLRLLGGSTEYSLHTALAATSEACVERDTSEVVHTGGTASTLLKDELFDVPTWLVGKKMRVVVMGKFSGTGTKLPRVFLGGALIVGFTSQSGSTQPFRMEVDMFPINTGTVDYNAFFIEGSLAQNVENGTRTTVTINDTDHIKLYGTNSTTGGTLTISAVEVYAG